MKINRNNYEPFFLLYIDNELSVQEKKSVDLFLKQNPDLQIEFDFFKLSVLNNESINFEDKKSLYKNNFLAIQEQLLHFIDGELNEVESEKIKSIIERDIEVKKEWNYLQQTKLLPDNSIEFKYKNLLYKKEANSVIYNVLWKLSIAAIFMGFGVWMIFNYYNGTQESKIILVTFNNSLFTPKKNINAVNTTKTVSIPLSNAATIYIAKKNNDSKIQKNFFKDDQLFLPKNDKQKTNIISVSAMQPNNSNTLANNTVPLIDNNLNRQDEKFSAVNTINVLDEPIDENKIFSIDEEKIKQTKVGRFFRKVKETFTSTAHIKIKAGENLKIGSFEIAIK